MDGKALEGFALRVNKSDSELDDGLFFFTWIVVPSPREGRKSKEKLSSSVRSSRAKLIPKCTVSFTGRSSAQGGNQFNSVQLKSIEVHPLPLGL
jgi:hypothetical protein